MKALLWKGYGIYDIYILNENNFNQVKETLLGMMYCYEHEVIQQIEESNYWGDLVEVVRENTYGDDSFESFAIVEVQE